MKTLLALVLVLAPMCAMAQTQTVAQTAGPTDSTRTVDWDYTEPTVTALTMPMASATAPTTGTAGTNLSTSSGTTTTGSSTTTQN